ncbi:MAG: SGNH/GDSL hydrolase family protein [Smithellaceae bacterium]|nr:SGNH/GDSL hydrolase family protein [Smithellaceae bacterium]
MKILVRGGSIAAGAGVKRSYVDILSSYYRPQGIEVLNRSAAGDNTFDAVASFDSDIAIVRPDILLLHFGVDDAYFPVYRSEFKENLVQIIRKARRLFTAQIVLLTSHPFSNEYEMDALAIYYRAIREVAGDLSCPMVSVHTYWAGWILERALPEHLFLQKDVRYPSEKGHEIIACATISCLDQLLGICW